MGGASTMKHSGASGAMQRVKCRTGGRSPDGWMHPAGMRHRQGPGEDRHLTRGMAQYAQGCWWGRFYTPTGCPAASGKGFSD